MKKKCDPLREQLLELLRGGNAHVDFEAAVAGLPVKLRGAKPRGQPHTPWRLLEHMHLAQWDILEFTRNPKHQSPAWPEGYWPEGHGPPDARAWNKTVQAFRADMQAMQDLVADPHIDLLRPLPHGQGQSVLREVLVLADHNAYHLGQLVLMRRLLGAWPD